MTPAALRQVPVDGLTPARLWAFLDPAARAQAAQALYAHDWGDAPTRREADVAVASSLRAREIAVRKMPVERRADYLARVVRPTDSLASSLLLALHLEHRRPMLAAFLDALGVPHRDGLISEEARIEHLDATSVATAARGLADRFPAEQVETYLATLLAMDRDVWGSLEGVLRSRAGEP